MAEKVNMPSQKKEKKKKRKKKLPSDFYDYNLLACTILLVSFGLIMLYSASAYEAASTFKGNDMYYFTHQAGLSAIVLVGIVILSKFVDYHSVWFQRIAALVYWGSLLLMAAVRFTPLGYEAYGARRWLRIGGGSLQPAEIGKLGLILYLPYIILKMGKNMRTIRAKAIVLGLGVLQALAAWILTDNLSTAIILGLIACVILFLADPEVKFYARVIPGAAVIGVFAIIILKNNLQIFERIGGDFRSNRIYEWLSGGSYQILQGLYAIGSGGFLGKGLGNRGDGIDLRHINFSVRHNALVGSDIDYLTDDAASVFIVLILDELALQTNRELVDDRRIDGFCFAGGQTAAGKFVGNFIAGLHAEIVRFDHVRSVGNADGKCAPCLDVLHGFMSLGEIQGDGVPLLHGAPCGVHDIHTAVLVVSCNHQNRHGENALCDFQFCSHDNFSL